MCALFCKSLCVINVGSPYGLHGVPVYILHTYDQMWMVLCKPDSTMLMIAVLILPQPANQTARC